MYTPCIFDWQYEVDIGDISKVLGGAVLMTWRFHKMEGNFRWAKGRLRQVQWEKSLEP